MSAVHPEYWVNDPDAQFAKLMQVTSTYCHPEAYDEAYDDLSGLAQRSHPPEWIREFKQQLREALQDPQRLPQGALSQAAQYGDGSDEAFLRRLWRDLYGDEPVSPSDGAAR